MRIHKHIILLYIFSIIALSSCEYIPKGENFTEVNPNVPPPDVVLDLSFGPDTLWIENHPFTIAYSADVGNNLVYAIFLMIGQDTLQEDYNNSGHFTFTPGTFYEAGTHDLQMDVITNANTGSLADVAGYEYLTFEYHWTLIIENAW